MANPLRNQVVICVEPRSVIGKMLGKPAYVGFVKLLSVIEHLPEHVSVSLLVPIELVLDDHEASECVAFTVNLSEQRIDGKYFSQLEKC